MHKLLGEKYIRQWLALVGTATLVLGATYTMVQQSTRLSANDQPIALSQVIKNQIEGGASPNDVISSSTVNLRSNDNVFTVVTDAQLHVLASSASLDGQSPLPPKGVFSYLDNHSSDTFTWQPASGVRLATHVVSYGKSPSSGFIVTGQSLTQSEKRIGIYGNLALAAWIAVIAWTYLIIIFPENKFPKTR